MDSNRRPLVLEATALPSEPKQKALILKLKSCDMTRYAVFE